jgi:hypothetical protein
MQPMTDANATAMMLVFLMTAAASHAAQCRSAKSVPFRECLQAFRSGIIVLLSLLAIVLTALRVGFGAATALLLCPW